MFGVSRIWILFYIQRPHGANIYDGFQNDLVFVWKPFDQRSFTSMRLVYPVVFQYKLLLIFFFAKLAASCNR